MVIEAIPSPGAEAVGQPADELSRLSDILLARGALDNRTLDRARRVAAETGGRLDQVLTQLGLVSERGLAEALAELVGSVLVGPADYPEAPLFQDRLKPKFLRRARALPIAATRRSRDRSRWPIRSTALPATRSRRRLAGRSRSRSPCRSSSKPLSTGFIAELGEGGAPRAAGRDGRPMPSRRKRMPSG